MNPNYGHYVKGTFYEVTTIRIRISSLGRRRERVLLSMLRRLIEYIYRGRRLYYLANSIIKGLNVGVIYNWAD